MEENKEESEEELTDGQELFIALLEGDDNEKDIEDKLYKYVCGKEYCWGHDGGEPDLVDILAIKLLEKVEEEKYLWSMIYSNRYLEHIGIKYKGKEKEG